MSEAGSNDEHGGLNIDAEEVDVDLIDDVLIDAMVEVWYDD